RAKEAGQGRKGDAEGAEEQRPLDSVGAAGHVGQQKRRADGERLARGLQADAAQAHAGSGGGPGVLEAVTAGEGLGEQLRAGAERLGGPGAEASGVGDEGGVVVLANGQAEGRTVSGQGSPPHRAVLQQGDSWPFLLLRLLDACLQLHPRPKLRDGQFFYSTEGASM